MDICNHIGCMERKATESKPKIIVIVRDGVLTDIRIPKGMKIDIEAVQIDKDYPDYKKLCEYENKVYEDDTMFSVDFESVHFDDKNED